MFYALSWFVIAALLALWSLAAWALQAIAVWTALNASARAGSTSGGGDLRLPDGLAPWVPPAIADAVHQIAAALGPTVDMLLRAAPALADGVAVVTWMAWALGCALLVLLGAALHLLIALWRRHGGGESSPSTGRSVAVG